MSSEDARNTPWGQTSSTLGLKSNVLLHKKTLFNPKLFHRYGYRPIPSEIDTAELEMLREALVSMGNDVHLLDKWYRKDTNKVEKKIVSYLLTFNNSKKPSN